MQKLSRNRHWREIELCSKRWGRTDKKTTQIPGQDPLAGESVWFWWLAESPDAENTPGIFQGHRPRAVPFSITLHRQPLMSSARLRVQPCSSLKGCPGKKLLVLWLSKLLLWLLSWVVPQFPVQFRCCCFSSAGKKPSREIAITSS